MTVRSTPAHEESPTLDALQRDVSRLEEELRLADARLREARSDYDRLRAEFLQAQKMETVGRMASGVAHDFKNVLTLIAGYSNILIKRVDTPDLREPVVEIQAACQRAIGLAQQLLAFSRKEAADHVALSLGGVLSDAATMLRRMLGASIDLTIKSEPALGLVMANAGQMHQVILNLVVNARDAMPNGGRLVIDARNVDVQAGSQEARGGAPAGASVLLSVADTGVGMDDATRARALEPFFTTKEGKAGTGLGLSTVHSVVTECRGRIILDSAPGRGTTVRIYLPRLTAVTEPAGERPAPRNEAPASSRLRRVAILDEDQSIQRLLADVLASAGYQAVAVPAGEGSFESRAAAHCDLAIVDLATLEHSRGRALLALRERCPAVKIIGLASSTGSLAGVLAHELGVGVTIAKPIAPRQLLRAVRDALEAD